MATRKRQPATYAIQKELRARRQASHIPDRRGWQHSRQEGDVTKLQEAERFSWEEGQGDFIPLTYAPTNTSWPENGFHHRRTAAAGYDRSKGILRVEFFTDGSVYDYGTLSPVPPGVAFEFRQAQSPGRYINTVLESFGYERIN